MSARGPVATIPSEAGSSLPARACWLQLGSLRCRIRHEDERHPRMLAEVFGTALVEARDGTPDVEIQIAVAPERVDPIAGIRVSPLAGGHLVETEPLSCRVSAAERPVRISVRIRQPDRQRDVLAHTFWIVFHRILMLLDRIVLHAAALRIGGRVFLFSGPKGAGKTTLSLALLQAGGTLLAEDHVLVQRRSERLWVSGCNARLRLTEATQRHFLPGETRGIRVDSGGVAKTEIQAADYFDARPYEDHPADRLYFNRVGERLRATRISRKDALLRLMRNTQEMQRLPAAADQQRYIDLLADVATHLPAYDLELEKSLAALDDLVAHLKES